METILQINTLPKPLEQMNNLVILLGDSLLSIGEWKEFSFPFLQAEIGAISQEGVLTIINSLVQKELVKGEGSRVDPMGHPMKLTLTMDGWEYYENLKRGSLSSRKVFMAMPFGNLELDKIVEECFRPAVKLTGFDLYRLDDRPEAGLIDDRLRVAISTSRFLIADLTDENRGAYWEAGFAEGLGKRAIYTCEKDKFRDKQTHFDTNHHLTVLWDKSNVGKSATDLKNTIRATFPVDAKMTDD
jgi:hypothetical protein